MHTKNNDTDKTKIEAKKAERRALAWLARQGGWEIRLGELHRIHFGATPSHSKVPDRPAA